MAEATKDKAPAKFSRESVFTMKKGTEFPETFAGAEIRFNVIEQPSSETDWDGLTAAIKGAVDNALTAHAVFVSAQRLEIQKDIKEQANVEGMTREKLQEFALDTGENGGAIIRNKRLRGTSGGTKKVSGKQKAKIEKSVYADMLADPNLDPATRQYLEQRQAALEKLGVETADAKASAQESLTTNPEAPRAPGRKVK